MDKPISIIILTYNKHENTINCLKSLRKQSYQNFEVIIVDNGSKYEIYKKLEKEIKQFERDFKLNLIHIKRNIFYTGGMNKGLKQAKGDYICLMCDDIELMPNFIETMVEFLDNYNDAGIICPKIKFYDNKDYIWYAGANINYKDGLLVRLRGFWVFDPLNQKFNNTSTTDFAAGTVFFIKKEIIERVGLLDDIFFMYHSELEWNYRAKKKGYKIYYVPSTIVYHRVPKDLNYAYYYFFFIRNSQIFVWIYGNLKQLIIFYLKFIFMNLKDISFLFIKYKIFYLVIIRLHSIWQGFRIGVKRRTNRSCKKILLKDYHFIKRNEGKMFLI